MPEDYLKSTDHYSRQYDSVTIESCRNIRDRSRDEIRKLRASPKINNEKIRIMQWACRLGIYIEAGERYKAKAEVVKEWIDRDKERDAKLSETKEPINIYCNKCGARMHFSTKILEEQDSMLRVLFFIIAQISVSPVEQYMMTAKNIHPSHINVLFVQKKHK